METESAETEDLAKGEDTDGCRNHECALLGKGGMP
jgi:hypothetical protein